MVAQFSWDDIADPAFENPARKAWREAVAEIAEKAKQTLPECNGRVESAVKIVLGGDVKLQDDGTARVASQSNGQTAYHTVNGSCDCKDYPKAPSNWCKHRIAAGMQKRAYALAKTKLAQLDGVSNGTGEPLTEPARVEAKAEAPALPEAPASCNVHVTLAGRKVQVTLRDSDETRLLARLEALLKRFPTEDEPEQALPEGWCSKHGVQMKERKGKYGPFYSHMTANGWCHGK
jgi:hypothetical protein